MRTDQCILLVGEVFVDFSVQKADAASKLRLGGVVHAARGLWAIGANYAVAAVCPGYLVDEARNYLEHHGCEEFIWLAEVKGAPNVIVIGDSIELAEQDYQDILRDVKTVAYVCDEAALSPYKNCLVFPGKFDLASLRNFLADDVKASFDIAYDVPHIDILKPYIGNLGAVTISTSSPMFLKRASLDLSGLLEDMRSIAPKTFILKENRGGSRVFDLDSETVEEIPALLGETVNSVGVGDVYSAVFVASLDSKISNAARKAAFVASCYAQTTFPDDFKRDAQRNLMLSVDQMRDLGGVTLPWHARSSFQIYFAAPDFSYVERKEIDQALRALAYHNFQVRRPVIENGEIAPGSQMQEMRAAFNSDVALLDECDLVFALPLDRDPGTLVEIGLALAAKKPVITYDPRIENANTMVMAGSTVYSDNLDTCLNGVFEAVSQIRAAH